MTRRSFSAVALTVFSCVAVAAAAVLILAVRPPVSWVAHAATRALPPGVTFESAGREAGRYHLSGVAAAGRPYGVRAERVTLQDSPIRSWWTGEWRFEARQVRLDPADDRLPPVLFGAGRARWRSGDRILELREWESDQAGFRADVAWTADGRIDSARLWGEADPAPLFDALSFWKKTAPSAPAGTSRRLGFEIEFAQGTLLVRVEGRPFFKASWR